ncbi:MAG TPA: hypothetical protein VM118_07490 [Acidobacteriota bacterium]|nr:hypothetical protein [Acidobacteriota bacterium]
MRNLHHHPMHTRLVVWIAAAVVVLTMNTASVAQTPDPLATVLAQVGMTADDLTFDYDDMSNYGGDEFVLPLFRTYHRHPLRIPYYVDFHADWLLGNWRNASGVIGFCSQRIDEGSRRGLIGDPAEKYRLAADSLTFNQVLDSLAVIAGWSGSFNMTAANQERWAGLPPLLRHAVAAIIYAAADTYRWRELAFADVAERYDMPKMYQKMLRVPSWDDEAYDTEVYEFIHLPRWKYLYVGAQDLARVVRWAADTLATATVPDDFAYRLETPWGVIAIGGGGDDEYPADDYLLIVDFGGDDVYAGGAANRSYDHPVSILIDCDGDDRYSAVADSLLPSFGGGVFGYAYLFDCAGNDEYHGASVSQGAGLFGVGCLVDESGDDRYIAHMTSQGSGTFGIGILIDSTGTDRYDTYLSSQGYGFTKGMGLLLDMEGNDTYVSNDTDIRYPSSQSAEHNDALSQGCGFGLRHDYIDGYSLAGGIGYLIDGGGDDVYSAGLFAQGCAYWYAIGVLWDRSGHDRYNGIWYVQGSGAHFGAGYLNDKSGNDHYVATMNMAQGAGHDFTIGFLLDEAGDDEHDAPNLSLGGGNANGIGLFWDKAGNDQYRVTAGTTLGRANVAGAAASLRDSIPTIGVFIDAGGGNDRYPPEKDFARNDTVWTQRGTNVEKSLNTEKGCGGDF